MCCELWKNRLKSSLQVKGQPFPRRHAGCVLRRRIGPALGACRAHCPLARFLDDNVLVLAQARESPLPRPAGERLLQGEVRPGGRWETLCRCLCSNRCDGLHYILRGSSRGWSSQVSSVSTGEILCDSKCGPERLSWWHSGLLPSTFQMCTRSQP